jgi:hypothetical protein
MRVQGSGYDWCWMRHALPITSLRLGLHTTMSVFIKRSILIFQISADPTAQELEHAHRTALAVTVSTALWAQTASSHASQAQGARTVQRSVCPCLNDCSDYV